MTRLFGTNGIRGIVGPEMNADLALKVGRAIGTSFGGGTVVLGRDTRLSGPMLARAAASGLMSAGCDVIDLGVVPTPCEQYFLAKSGHPKGGVVVTASHHPRDFPQRATGRRVSRPHAGADSRSSRRSHARRLRGPRGSRDRPRWRCGPRDLCGRQRILRLWR